MTAAFREALLRSPRSLEALADMAAFSAQPDYDIDIRICQALGKPPGPFFTGNLEFALMLIPPGSHWRWTLCRELNSDGNPVLYAASVTWGPKGQFIDMTGSAATPAQAMTAAALRARAAWERVA